MSMSLLFNVALLAAFGLAMASVVTGARGGAPVARLAGGGAGEAPAVRPQPSGRDVRRGLANLGLVLTPTGSRTRLVLKLNAAGRPGPAAWHGFLAMRGALAIAILAASLPVAWLWTPGAMPALAAGGWLLWRWQELRLDQARHAAPDAGAPAPARVVPDAPADAPAGTGVARGRNAAAVAAAAEEPAGEGPLTRRLREASAEAGGPAQPAGGTGSST